MKKNFFQVQMYQGTGELKKKIQSSKSSTLMINQSMFKYNQGTSVMALNARCQSFTVEIKFKCDDLVHQVSITNSDHYQLLVELYSIKAQSTLK